jgi:hypothetical protein
MSKQNYKEIENSLTVLDNFKGNSAEGEWIGDVYAVFSYNTIIATYDRSDGKRWVCPNKYSVTTSRLQNMVRRVWSVN